jgi:hypothetical protein
MLIKGMNKQKIDVVYNERVCLKLVNLKAVLPETLASGYSLNPMTITTESGKSFEADCVFKTIGNAKFNSELIKSLVAELEVSVGDAMNDKGQIKVKTNGLLDFGSIDNVYAVGDGKLFALLMSSLHSG